MPRPTVTFDALLAALAEGPCQPDELLARLEVDLDDAAGVDAVASLVDATRLVDLPDGRIADGLRLVEGVVARHRLGEDEVAARRVDLTDDLFVPLAGAPDAATVRVGGESCPVASHLDRARPEAPAVPSVGLPAGWEPDLAAGDQVGLALVAGELELRRLADAEGDGDRGDGEGPGPGDGEGDRGAEVFAAAVTSVAVEQGHHVAGAEGTGGDGWVVDLVSTLLAVTADHPVAVRGLQVPMGEALDAAGLRSAGGLLAGAGVTDEVLAVVRAGHQVMGGGRFDPGGGRLAEAVGTAWLLLMGAAGDDLPEGDRHRVVGRLLADPEVSQVLVDHARSGDQGDLEVLAGGVRQARAAVPEALGAAWLEAELALMAGDAGAAMAELDTALLDADPDTWFGPLALRGHLRAVAGDLEGAASAFRRLGDREAAAYVARWRPVVEGVGRNDRCPCGSGRKYKQCCLATPRPVALEERVELVWWKAQTWCLRAARRTMPWFSSPDPVEDPLAFLAVDAHLVEDGRLVDAVAEMGPLLPADEATLMDRWSSHSRALWLVERSGDGGAVLRDLEADQTVEVRLGPDLTLIEGQVVLALVVPSGRGPDQVVGSVVRVPDDERQACLDLLQGAPAGQELLDWVVAMGAAVDRAASPPDRA
ncbi:MAG TPA: SEC-C domain-containing protein [Acidimicrobiales bacterium]|nr:SEC-C domain-containing protein [Acidimicrobiales bacterium]